VGRPALRQVVPDDETIDTAEVPATVVCARCGSPDCLGCSPAEENTQPSGVIAIIPWERRVGSAWSRLWSTAVACTQRPESFFGPMPNGELSPAFAFSVTCELLAISSVALTLLAALFAIFPGWSFLVMRDPHLRGLLLRLVMLGIPAFAGLLVTLHILYGWAVDRGAVRSGAKPHRAHALRFGMYACGLDLMTSPIGALYMLLTRGIGPTLDLVPAAFNVPSSALRALLRRVYHLTDESVPRARKYSTIVIAIASLVMVFGVMVLLVASLFV
jgi:hypothetical protein